MSLDIYPMKYEISSYYLIIEKGMVNWNEIPDPEEQLSRLEQIFHLGQTPTQLFRVPHPQKKKSTQQDFFGLQTQPQPVDPSKKNKVPLFYE